MCSAFILSRLDQLNQQLIVISKLQKMEQESKPNSNSRYKKVDKRNALCYLKWSKTCKKNGQRPSTYNVQNNFRKPCRCEHHALSLKEQCGKWNCSVDYNASNNNIKKALCCLETCKPRRKVCTCRDTRSTEGQTEMEKDEQLLKYAQINTEKNVATDFSSIIPEKQNKSDQTDLYTRRIYSNEKQVNSWEGKDKENVPTKETAHRTVLQDNSKDLLQLEKPKNGNNQIKSDQSVIQAAHHSEKSGDVQEVPTKDKKDFEKIEEELLNERKRTKELEEKLKSLTCSFKCLKEDSEQTAACLKDALETAEERAKLAITSRNLAMDLAKREKDQTDTDNLLKEIMNLQKQIVEITQENKILMQERDSLKCKLENLSEDDAMRCREVVKEVNRLKCGIKEKEDALNKERKEFKEMIMVLTNVIKIQKRRICEVTGICNNQRNVLHEKDEELSQKNAQLTETHSLLQSSDCNCKELEVEIEHLKYSLHEEEKACSCLKQELETLRENHGSELRIKEKIIEEQTKTLTRQRKLLRDSEKMAEQAGCEFDQLKKELYCEKQKCNSLEISLKEAENQLNNLCSYDCNKCQILATEIEFLNQEKQKALATAKFAIQKLYHSGKEYQKRLNTEKQQHKFMTMMIQEKETEIEYLKREIYQSCTKTMIRN